jgi:hypothetical protein
MADLSDIIKYENLFTLQLRHPVTEQPLSMTMKIRSASSDAVKAIVMKQANKNFERRVKGKLPKGEQEVDEILERTAACIAEWDWGEESYHGEKPELTIKTAMKIMRELGWMFGQVKEASDNIENFTEPSVMTSAAT